MDKEFHSGIRFANLIVLEKLYPWGVIYMRKSILLIMTLSLLAFSPSYASFNWDLYDFGDNPFDHNNNWSPVDYPYGIGELPSPGYLGEGGEEFDLEGSHFAIQGNTAHIALVNSFGYTAHSTGWNQNYNLGDIFFGFDGGNTQYAIDVSEGRLVEVGTYVGIPDKDGTYFDYTDIRNEVGAWEIGRVANDFGQVQNSLQYWGQEPNPMQGNGDTYVWEFAFDISQLSGFNGASTVSFHNTLECGNDLINESYSMVPEPGTMLLIGLGLLGLGVARKKIL